MIFLGLVFVALLFTQQHQHYQKTVLTSGIQITHQHMELQVHYHLQFPNVQMVSKSQT